MSQRLGFDDDGKMIIFDTKIHSKGVWHQVFEGTVAEGNVGDVEPGNRERSKVMLKVMQTSQYSLGAQIASKDVHAQNLASSIIAKFNLARSEKAILAINHFRVYAELER